MIEKSLRGLEAKVDALRKKLGDDDPEVIKLISELALRYEQEKQFGKAIALQAIVVDSSKHNRLHDGPGPMVALHRLARMHSSNGDYRDSIYIQKNMLRTLVKKFGINHTASIAAMQGIAQTLKKSNQINQAVKMCEGVVAADASVFGPESHQTLADRLTLSDMLRDAGRIDDARTIELDVISISGRQGLDPHFRLRPMVNILMDGDVGQGLEESFSIFMQVVCVARLLPINDPMRFVIRSIAAEMRGQEIKSEVGEERYKILCEALDDL